VWLYVRFCLSYRGVEALMAARGLILTYEAVRYWCREFGQFYANQLRRRRPRPGDKEVLLPLEDKGQRGVGGVIDDHTIFPSVSVEDAPAHICPDKTTVKFWNFWLIVDL
jgi:hypothetical protein